MQVQKPESGLLLLDKPVGISSRDAIDKAQRWFSKGAAMGHAGTLDPLASGLLVVCLGWTTRLVEYVQDLGKVYRAVFFMGARSATDDSEGPIEPVPDAVEPTAAQVEIALTSFQGQIEQVPPNHSAAWVDGKRAYKLARKGREVAIAPRKVHVKEICLEEYSYPRIRLKIDCGKGTYIRSIARDLGNLLGTGAYVEALDRVSIGGFHKEHALSPMIVPENPWASILPPHRAIEHYPKCVLEPESAQRLCLGTAIPAPSWLGHEKEHPGLAIFDTTGRFRAVGRMYSNEGTRMLTPTKVFHESGA